MAENKELNDQQMMCVEHWFSHFNATRAAREAGYSESYATSTCTMWFSRRKESCLPKFHHVWEYVNERKKKAYQDIEENTQFVMMELFRLYGADIREAFDKKGKLKKISDMPEDVAKLILSIDHGKQKVKFESPLKIIERLGHHRLVNAFKEPTIDVNPTNIVLGDDSLKEVCRRLIFLLGQEEDDGSEKIDV